MVPPASHRVPRVRWYSGIAAIPTPRMSLTGLSPSVVGRSRPFNYPRGRNEPPTRGSTTTPQPPGSNACRLSHRQGFGFCPCGSPLPGQSRLIYVPAGTEMFHFTAFGFPRLWIGRGIPRITAGRVAPFGDPRINACLRLPGAYRSLPRPSSLVETKASTVQLLVA